MENFGVFPLYSYFRLCVSWCFRSVYQADYCVSSSGSFTGVWIYMWTFRNTRVWRWNRQCSETSVYNIKTPGNYPEENTHNSEQVESLKSWKIFTDIRNVQDVCNRYGPTVQSCGAASNRLIPKYCKPSNQKHWNWSQTPHGIFLILCFRASGYKSNKN